MKLSEHIQLCEYMLENFGDGEVTLIGREGEDYVNEPRISFMHVSKSFELSNQIKGNEGTIGVVFPPVKQ
jgi:hypothetical protein